MDIISQDLAVLKFYFDTKNICTGQVCGEFTSAVSKFHRKFVLNIDSIVQEETKINYLERNKESFKIKHPYDLNGLLVPISNEIENDIFESDLDEGWDKFRLRYPKSKGIIDFSLPGYNKERSEIVLYFAHHFGPRYGSGSFIYMNREEEKYSIINTRLDYIC